MADKPAAAAAAKTGVFDALATLHCRQVGNVIIKVDPEDATAKLVFLGDQTPSSHATFCALRDQARESDSLFAFESVPFNRVLCNPDSSDDDDESLNDDDDYSDISSESDGDGDGDEDKKKKKTKSHGDDDAGDDMAIA